MTKAEKPVKVFAVIHSEMYEGDILLEIFSSKQRAMHFAKKEAEKHYSVHIFGVTKILNGYEVGCTRFYVEAKEVL